MGTAAFLRMARERHVGGRFAGVQTDKRKKGGHLKRCPPQPVEKDKKTFARPDVRRAGKYLYRAKGNFVCEVREIALLCAGKEN